MSEALPLRHSFSSSPGAWCACTASSLSWAGVLQSSHGVRLMQAYMLCVGMGPGVSCKPITGSGRARLACSLVMVRMPRRSGHSSSSTTCDGQRCRVNIHWTASHFCCIRGIHREDCTASSHLGLHLPDDPLHIVA